MSTHATLQERLTIVNGVTPQDINTDRTSSYVSVGDYRRVAAILTTHTVTATKKATVQLLQATASDGTGSKALTDPVEVVAPTGNGALTAMTEATIESMDTAGGFSHVAVKVTCDEGSSVNGAAVLVFSDGRYRP